MFVIRKKNYVDSIELITDYDNKMDDGSDLEVCGNWCMSSEMVSAHISCVSCW